MSTKAERIETILDAHTVTGYFVTADGHRECYCGHVLQQGETLRSHTAAVLAAAQAFEDREAANRIATAARIQGEAEMRNRAHAAVDKICPPKLARQVKSELRGGFETGQ